MKPADEHLSQFDQHHSRKDPVSTGPGFSRPSTPEHRFLDDGGCAFFRGHSPRMGHFPLPENRDLMFMCLGIALTFLFTPFCYTRRLGQPCRLMADTGETVVIPVNSVHPIRKARRPDELFLVVIKKHMAKLSSKLYKCKSALLPQNRNVPTCCGIAIHGPGPGPGTKARGLELSKPHLPSILSLGAPAGE